MAQIIHQQVQLEYFNNKLIKTKAMKKPDYLESCENVLFTRRQFNENVPLSKVIPFLIIAAYQNKIDINKAKELNKLLNICENSINYN